MYSTLKLFLELMIIIILISILSYIFNRIYIKVRGFFGEFWIDRELHKLNLKEYKILKDIMIKIEGKTHQIDHIILSKYGIFVIETKNYFGKIIGNEYKEQWTQYLGKNKYHFHNPIWQNYGHIKTLSEYLELPEDKFISIVCFSNQCKIDVSKYKTNVTQLDNLNQVIRQYHTVIINEDLDKLYQKLINTNIKDKRIRKQHVKNIQENIEKQTQDTNMICPQCGGKLIKKKGKYGHFIGCSNYPNCNYIKKRSTK